MLSDKVKIQNIFILAANYVFYGWWDWRFLFLIIFISTIHFWGSQIISKISPELLSAKRKIIFMLILTADIVLLGIFKYFNFFTQSAIDFLSFIGIQGSFPVIKILLPVGISFYTFQAMSYTIDVYNTKIEAAKDAVSFYAYLSFFPLVLAGPIERAENLLTQFTMKRKFQYIEITQGLKQILWGLFKKLVVADRAAIYVDAVYNNPEQHSGISFIAATVFFAFQIYCDFSGYSDIAIGSARLLGLNLTSNFNLPYFSKSVVEFWRRWHISLSSWLRDYLFIPLNLQLRNLKFGSAAAAVMVTFLICGLWHGANWTFIVWGLLHGIFIISSTISAEIRNKIFNTILNKKIRFVRTLLQIAFTFTLITFSWIFFRADNLNEAFIIFKKIFSFSGQLYIPQDDDIVVPFYAVIGIVILVFAELKLEFLKNKYLFMNNKNIVIRYAAYAVLILLIMLAGVFDGGQFIYFQF